MNIYNKTIQRLIDTDESGLILALSLLTDRKSLIYWYRLNDVWRQQLGLRKGGDRYACSSDILGKFCPMWMVYISHSSTEAYIYLKSIQPSI